MAKVSVCPSVADLQKLAAGDLPSPDMEPLLEHLETCDSCFAKVKSLPAADTLLDVLTKAKTLPEGPDEELVTRMIERLVKLGPQADPKIAFACASCGKNLQVEGKLAGKKVRCPGCSQVIAVPAGPRDVSQCQAATPPPSSSEEKTIAPSGEGKKPEPAEGDNYPTRAAAATEAVAPDEPSWDFLAPAEQPDEIGRLGSYRVLKVLGQGGMGVVFKAEDAGLQRLVALKAMLPSLATSGSAKQRFMREARAAAGLKHDHIVTIHQVGEDRGAPFLAMEFLEGESLEVSLKREHNLPVAEVLRIGRQVADGLAAAHAKGLIHRDIKPGNIWLECESAERESAERERTETECALPRSRAPALPARVKILDFGLARAASDTSLTQSGAIVGTPAYMAPEQAGGKNVDHRCDLFSLGCVLYRMATGEMPFKGNDTLALLSSLAMDNPAPPQALDFNIPPALSDLIMKLLAKKPDDRPSSAREVADALAAIETGNVGHTALRAQPRSPARRRRLPWAIAASVLSLLGVGLLAQQIIIRITDEEGNTRDIKIPEGGKFEVIRPPMKDIPAGDPLCKLALVTNPAIIKGLQSWTVETVGHRAGVRALAFSHKGNWLASGGIDGQVRIWDTKTWKLDRILPGDALVENLTWDKDDNLWVVSDKVHLWNPAKGIRLRSFKGAGSVWLFPDGKRVLVDGTVHDAATGEILDRIDKFGLPDGKTLASIDKGRVYFWDAQTEKPIRDIPLPDKAGGPIAWGPDGKTLACLRDNNVLRVDATNGKILEQKTLPKDLGSRDHAAISKSAMAIFVRSPNTHSPALALSNPNWEKMELWTNTVAEVHTIPPVPAWSPDGKVLAVSTSILGSLYLIRSGEKEPFRVLPGHGKLSIKWLAWTDNGGKLVDFGNHLVHENSRSAFDSSSGKFLGRVPGWGFLSPSGKNNAVPLDANLHFGAWDGKKGFSVRVGGGGPFVVNWSQDSKVLLIGQQDGKVRLFSTMDGKEMKGFDRLGRVISGVAISPDGKTIAYGNGIDFVLLDKDTGVQKHGFGHHGAYGVAYSPDGKFLAFADNTSVEIRSADGKEVLKAIQYGHHDNGDGRLALAWSPDSRTLATAPENRLSKCDGLIRLWDAATGKLNASLLTLAEGRGLTVSAQGHFVGTPHELVRRRDVVYVFQTDQGIETLPPDEFERRFGWKNEPSQVRLTGK